jgi:hypothetical protein
VQTLDDFWNGVCGETWLEAPRSWDAKAMQAVLPHHPLPIGLQEALAGLSGDLSRCVKTSIVNALHDYEPEREIVVHVRFPFHPKHSFTHTRAIDDPSSSWSEHASGLFMTGFAPRLTKLWAHQQELHKLSQHQQTRVTAQTQLAILQTQDAAAKARVRKRTNKKKAQRQRRLLAISLSSTPLPASLLSATASSSSV